MKRKMTRILAALLAVLLTLGTAVYYAIKSRHLDSRLINS